MQLLPALIISFLHLTLTFANDRGLLEPRQATLIPCSEQGLDPCGDPYTCCFSGSVCNRALTCCCPAATPSCLCVRGGTITDLNVRTNTNTITAQLTESTVVETSTAIDADDTAAVTEATTTIQATSTTTSYDTESVTPIPLPSPIESTSTTTSYDTESVTPIPLPSPIESTSTSTSYDVTPIPLPSPVHSTTTVDTAANNNTATSATPAAFTGGAAMAQNGGVKSGLVGGIAAMVLAVLVG